MIGLLEAHMASCMVDAAKVGGREADDKVRKSLRRDRPPRPLLSILTHNKLLKETL